MSDMIYGEGVGKALLPRRVTGQVLIDAFRAVERDTLERVAEVADEVALTANHLYGVGSSAACTALAMEFRKKTRGMPMSHCARAAKNAQRE